MKDESPERIWVSACGKALVTEHPRWDGDVEYIRAYLAPSPAPDVRVTDEMVDRLRGDLSDALAERDFAEDTLQKAEAEARTAYARGLEDALEANRAARENVIHSGLFEFVRGVQKGHDRADDAIRALATQEDQTDD